MKILKGIISSLIAIILVPILMVFILYLSTRNMVSKDGVKDLFKSVSLSDFLIDNDGNYTEFGKKIKDDLVAYGVPADVVEEFVDYEQISDFFSEYTGDAVSFIVYDANIDDIKAEDISKLINDNIDDIVDDLRERKVEGYEELTDERVNQIKSEVNNLSAEIEEALPDLKKYVEESDASTAIKIVRIVFSKAMVMIFAAVIGILALLIILLNLKNFRYGIWLGVISMIASFPFIIIGNANVNVNVEESYSKALEDAIKFALNRVSTTALFFFIGGIVLITLTIIIRVIKKHSGKKDSNITIAQPVAPQEPVAPVTSQETVAEEVATAEVSQPVTPVTEETPVEQPALEEAPVVPAEPQTVAEQPKQEGENVCDSCGAKLNEGQKFCYNCGASKK